MKRDYEERKKSRDALLARLKVIVGDIELPRFEEALTHPSFANEAGGAPDYERLEFLGDAVLGLCVSELLVGIHRDADEGTLSRMRSALVNADALARFARTEGIGASLALGRGAAAAGEQFRTNVLADAVEALVAAVYEAGGLSAARALVQEVVREPLATAAAVLAGRDPKSALQESVQAQGHLPPSYRVVATLGPAHERVFQVEVLVGERVLAQGVGPSKRLAERAAAAAALEVENLAPSLAESVESVESASTGESRPGPTKAEGRSVPEGEREE